MGIEMRDKRDFIEMSFNFAFNKSKSSHWRRYSLKTGKQVFLKTSQNLQENIRARVPFNKVTG